MLEASQKAVIHVAIQQLGLSNEDYKTILMSNFGVDSCVKLESTQFQELMKIFERLGFKNPKKTTDKVPRISRKQIWKINELWEELCKHGYSKEGLAAFIKRQSGKEKLEWCTSREGYLITEGIKKIIERSKKNGISENG